MRYQIHLGECEFKIFMKIYVKGKYEPYREIPMEFIDPIDELTTINTGTKNTIPEDEMEDDIPKSVEPEWSRLT